MNTVAFQLARICLVIALVCVAAVLATPKGRLPLALRGVAKMLACDRRQSIAVDGNRQRSASVGKRAIAFTLVILAIILALI